MEMKLVALTLVTLAFPAFASSAKIFAYDSDHGKTEVALDSKHIPRNNGDKKSYPTIKDFREESAMWGSAMSAI